MKDLVLSVIQLFDRAWNCMHASEQHINRQVWNFLAHYLKLKLSYIGYVSTTLYKKTETVMLARVSRHKLNQLRYYTKTDKRQDVFYFQRLYINKIKDDFIYCPDLFYNDPYSSEL